MKALIFCSAKTENRRKGSDRNSSLMEFLLQYPTLPSSTQIQGGSGVSGNGASTLSLTYLGILQEKGRQERGPASLSLDSLGLHRNLNHYFSLFGESLDSDGAQLDKELEGPKHGQWPLPTAGTSIFNLLPPHTEPALCSSKDTWGPVATHS